jgi:hypothetical protein
MKKFNCRKTAIELVNIEVKNTQDMLQSLLILKAMLTKQLRNK